MWIPNVSNVILKIDDIEKFHSMMSGTKYFALSLTAKAYCACSKPLTLSSWRPIKSNGATEQDLGDDLKPMLEPKLDG